MNDILYSSPNQLGIITNIEEPTMEEFKTGAKRSERKPRYDLIPKVALDRLALRFTGEFTSINLETLGHGSIDNKQTTGGALKYGECNWEKGLPTSDVINHIYDHLTTYVDSFRRSLKTNNGDMALVKRDMELHSKIEDDLAAAMWGLTVLMHQESFDGKMFHDDRFTVFFNEVPKVESSQPSELSIEYLVRLENKLKDAEKELHEYRQRATRSKDKLRNAKRNKRSKNR